MRRLIWDRADLFIIDQDGHPLFRVARHHPFKTLSGTGVNHRLREQEETGTKVSFPSRSRWHPHLVTFARLESADWYVVATVPYAYLNYEAGLIGKDIFLGLGCFFLAVLLSILFTKSIVSPLHALIKAMNQVKQGNLSFKVPDNSKDEIAVVAHRFNEMVKEIKLLMKDIKQKESQKRKAELMALQAQINPHFLSNFLTRHGYWPRRKMRRMWLVAEFGD